MNGPLLDVRDLHAGYAQLDVLRGISLTVDAGELVAVLGPNGAGKSTLLRAISRIGSQVRSGTVIFGGTDLLGQRAEAVVALGCLHVPEGRALFTELSVDDNLRLGGYRRPRREVEAAVCEMYERFPPLAARRNAIAFSLSGGEQQMLAVGRALVAKPKLLMLDEPSTGLAPLVVEEIFRIVGALARAGTAILLVEQNAYVTLRHADRAYVLESGRIALSGTAQALGDDPRVRAIYLGGAVGEE